MSHSQPSSMKYTGDYEAPWASSSELHVIDTSAWRYQRPVARTDKCCQCGTCYLFCPTGCVRDKGTHFAADLGYCKGCGICARLCPAKAITMVREA